MTSTIFEINVLTTHDIDNDSISSYLSSGEEGEEDYVAIFGASRNNIDSSNDNHSCLIDMNITLHSASSYFSAAAANGGSSSTCCNSTVGESSDARPKLPRRQRSGYSTATATNSLCSTDSSANDHRSSRTSSTTFGCDRSFCCSEETPSSSLCSKLVHKSQPDNLLSLTRMASPYRRESSRSLIGNDIVKPPAVPPRQLERKASERLQRKRSGRIVARRGAGAGVESKQRQRRYSEYDEKRAVVKQRGAAGGVVGVRNEQRQRRHSEYDRQDLAPRIVRRNVSGIRRDNI